MVTTVAVGLLTTEVPLWVGSADFGSDMLTTEAVGLLTTELLC